MTPNIVAYVALALWPFLSLTLFAKMRTDRALVWSILLAYLFLPPQANFDLPVMPALDKVTIPALVAFLAVVLWRGRWVPPLPGSLVERSLLVAFVLSPLATAWTNPDVITFNVGGLQALTLWDGFSSVIRNGLTVLLYLLGRELLASERGQREALFALAATGLIYSIPMLIEVRFSPQLNRWIYGFFQHEDFSQTIRFGGFRPTVFLQHSLWVALFAAMSLMASLALLRHKAGFGGRLQAWATGWLALVLVLCKSYAAFAYGIFIAPLILLTSSRTQIRVAAVLVVLSVAYPALRQEGLLPTETVVAAVATINAERADSLGFRFDNEDMLLARAQERPWFGWGEWGRNLVHDPETGRSVTVTDGRWIITFGMYGWVGFLSEFLLLAAPVMVLWRRSRRPGVVVSPFAATLALVIGVNMTDMLPNATLTSLTWLFAGAMMGYAAQLRADARERVGALAGLGVRASPSPAGRAVPWQVN